MRVQLGSGRPREESLINVNQLIDRVAEGTMSAEMCGELLAKEFPAARPAVRSVQDVEDVLRREADGQLDEFQSGSLDEVRAAYVTGRLSDEQYAAIYQAIAGEAGP